MQNYSDHPLPRTESLHSSQCNRHRFLLLPCSITVKASFANCETTVLAQSTMGNHQCGLEEAVYRESPPRKLSESSAEANLPSACTWPERVEYTSIPLWHELVIVQVATSGKVDATWAHLCIRQDFRLHLLTPMSLYTVPAESRKLSSTSGCRPIAPQKFH